MKKIASLILIGFIFISTINAQQKSDSIKTALLIVDIQEFYFPSENRAGLVNAEEASLVAKAVLESFREKKQLVVHVRHQSSKGFAIHKNVMPIEGEKVITKTEVNSFLGTDLLEYLKNNEINRLVIIGMQTQMCLEGAVRAGHDYGFECIVVEDACTTRDLKFGDKVIKAADVHASTLATFAGGGYAKVIDLKSFEEKLVLFLFKEIE